MWEDIVKRPYITMGMLGLRSLIRLAATSTAGMIKRLGARRWRRLHRLAYLAGVAGCVHFLWLPEGWRADPELDPATLVLPPSIPPPGIAPPAARPHPPRPAGTRAAPGKPPAS